MLRVFISHSSKQSSFVSKLAESVGQDRCIIDCYDFRSGEKLGDEIKRKIDQARLFCLLISDTALDSDWVTMEVQYVREKVESGATVFRAFIIDEDVQSSDTRISPWVTNFLLHTIPSSKIVGRVLTDNLRELDYKNYPILQLRDSLFIGRGQELSTLETEYVLKSGIKAVIVSGLPHVGRKRFSLEFLRKVSGDDRQSFCMIFLDRNKSIEDLILYLNDLVELYSQEDLLQLLVNEAMSRKMACVIQLINKLYDYHQTILINDEFCLILPNGHFVDWFKDVLKSNNLNTHAGLYIISKVGVNIKEVERLPIVQQSLFPLDIRSIQAIVKAYAEPQRFRIPDEDIKRISATVKGLPSLVYPIVDAWIKYNKFVAYDKMRELEKGMADLLEYIVDILNDSGNEEQIQLLLLLAYFELISITQLQKLYPVPNLDEMLDSFQDLSILEFFGYSKEYIRMHPLVADFLRRSKRISLTKEFIERISFSASAIVKAIDTSESDDDIATYIFGIKQVLKDGLSTEKDISKYMIPSLTLNVIIEEYENENYPGVLTLCDQMLSGEGKGYDEHIERSVHYWQCLAFCRLKDRRLFDAVAFFKDSHTYHFLLGFFFRMQEMWEKAEKEYEIALRMAGTGANSNKTKQELVLVRIKLGDFKGALLLAEENYKRQRFNAFFIEAYYRCLVKDPYSDPMLMKSLISDMEKSQDRYHTENANTMKAEFAYYYEGDFWKAVQLLQGTIEQYSSIQYTREAFAAICKDAKRPEVYRDFMKKISL